MFVSFLDAFLLLALSWINLVHAKAAGGESSIDKISSDISDADDEFIKQKR